LASSGYIGSESCNESGCRSLWGFLDLVEKVGKRFINFERVTPGHLVNPKATPID
jgi:hypothetical protein